MSTVKCSKCEADSIVLFPITIGRNDYMLCEKCIAVTIFELAEQLDKLKDRAKDADIYWEYWCKKCEDAKENGGSCMSCSLCKAEGDEPSEYIGASGSPYGRMHAAELSEHETHEENEQIKKDLKWACEHVLHCEIVIDGEFSSFDGDDPTDEYKKAEAILKRWCE
jgi:hypothetical protein